MLDYCLDRSILINQPDQPTYIHPRGSASVLVIALTRGCQLTSLKSISDLSSDHNPVVSKLRVRPLSTETHPNLDYSHANWPLYSARLTRQLVSLPIIRDDKDLDRADHYFTASIRQAATAAIPRKEVKQRHMHFPPSFRLLLKFRNSIRRRFQRTRLQVLAILHSVLNWIISNLLRGYLNAKWKTFLGSLHPQKAVMEDC
jgi:hypothetical protein